MLLGGLWFSAETGWMQAGSHGEIENHIDAKDRDDYAKCCATLGPELAQRVKEYDNPLPRPAVAL